jgi:prepilin signal peptidase PulO-like enzyme (type II secretory pathway)
MASHRLALEGVPTKQLLLQGSFCPNCNNTLKVKNLFPVLSWVFQKGKCSFCLTKISARYPAIEIATGTLFVLIFLATGSKIDLKLILIILITVTLLIMVVTDLENYFIPDITQIILAILALTYHLALSQPENLLDNLSYYLWSAIAFCAFGLALHFGFYFVTKKQGIGEDDLKFFLVAGLMLGYDNLMIFMIINGLFGVIFGLFWTKILKDDTFPFAPALVASSLLCLIFKIDIVVILGTILYYIQSIPDLLEYFTCK